MGTNGLSSKLNGSNTHARFKTWRPRRWHPYYEEIVALSASGYSNTYIAEKYGYTPQHISNIINLPEAIKILGEIRNRIHETVLETIPKRIDNVAAHALDVCEEIFIKRKKDILERSPLALVDRSMKFLQGVGKLAGEEKQQVNNIFVSEHVHNTLAIALDKAKEVRQLYSEEKKE